MNSASRVLIVKNKKILFIHRIKNNKEYYVLPGGSIEKGETSEEAAIREAKEETNFDIKIDSLLWHFKEIVDGESRYGYYFLVKKFSGELKLSGPEAVRQSKDNQYMFVWLSLDKLKNLLIYPEELKDRIIKFLSEQ